MRLRGPPAGPHRRQPRRAPDGLPLPRGADHRGPRAGRRHGPGTGRAGEAGQGLSRSGDRLRRERPRARAWGGAGPRFPGADVSGLGSMGRGRSSPQAVPTEKGCCQAAAWGLLVRRGEGTSSVSG